MRMRWKPLRGQKHKTVDGIEVTILEVISKTMVKIVTPSGFVSAELKNKIDLPIIDTANYERIDG